MGSFWVKMSAQMVNAMYKKKNTTKGTKILITTGRENCVLCLGVLEINAHLILKSSY